MLKASATTAYPQLFEHDVGRCASWVLRVSAIENASSLTMDDGFFMNITAKAHAHRLQGGLLCSSEGRFLVVHFNDQSPPAGAAWKSLQRFLGDANLCATSLEPIVPLDALHLEQFGWASPPAKNHDDEDDGGGALAPHSMTLAMRRHAARRLPRPDRVSMRWFVFPDALHYKTSASMSRDRLLKWTEFRLRRLGKLRGLEGPEDAFLPAYVAAAMRFLPGPPEARYRYARGLFDAWAKSRLPSYRVSPKLPAAVAAQLDALRNGTPPARCSACNNFKHNGKCIAAKCPGLGSLAIRKCRRCHGRASVPAECPHTEGDLRERMLAMERRKWALRVLSVRDIVGDKQKHSQLVQWLRSPKTCGCRVMPWCMAANSATCQDCVRRLQLVRGLNELPRNYGDGFWLAAVEALRVSTERLNKQEVRKRVYQCSDAQCKVQYHKKDCEQRYKPRCTVGNRES